MKIHTREAHETLSALALARFMAIAISVISAIYIILLVTDDITKAKSLQAHVVTKPTTSETPDTDPVGGPYLPQPGLGEEPSSRPVHPKPPVNPLYSVDRALASMKWANIAFNVPEKMNLKDRAQIHLLLSLQKSMDELRREIVAAGKREGATIQVTNRMEANLTCQEGSFKILKITPEEQIVGSEGVFEWKWEVEPLAPGVHTLYLSLIAHLSVDGVPSRKSVKTFEKKIQVEVSVGQWAWQFYEENWQWLWTFILIPAVAWLGTLWLGKRRRRKR